MIRAFHEKGNSVRRGKSTGRKPWPLPVKVVDYIKDNLEANSFFSLREWVSKIEQIFGFPITKERLRRAFIRMNITYARLKTAVKTNLHNQVSHLIERK